MSKELYINGRLCDLNEKDNPIAITLQVNNLAEVRDRQASSSNRFTLPWTENNRKIFEYPDDPGFVQINPYRNLPARLVQNGIEVIPNGIAVTTQALPGGIEIQVISGVIDFFDLIDGKKLWDLDLSAYDHTFSFGTVVSSQVRTSGYKYPVIDYGALPVDNNEVDVRLLRPATFSATIFDEIITQAGFTYEGLFLEEDRFKRELVPFANDKFEHGKDYDASINSVAVRNTDFQVFSETIREQVVLFQEEVNDPSGSWSNNEFAAQEILKVRVSVAYDIIVRDIHGGGDPPRIYMKVQKWDGSTWSDLAFNQHVAWAEFTNIDYFDQIIEIEAEVNAGDKLRLWARSEPATQRVRGTLLQGATMKVEALKTDVVFGQTVELAATLPDMTQKDFIKDVMQRYCLTPTIDPYSRHIRFRSFSELYSRKLQAEDWTRKFVEGMASVEFKIGEYARVNNGKYKEDENVPTELGQGQIIIDNETLKAETDLVVSKFAASESVIKLNGKAVALIRKVEDILEPFNYSGKTAPRILIDEIIDASIKFIGSANPKIEEKVSTPYFIEDSRPGLGFDELFADYYLDFQQMLIKSRKERREVMLDALDIFRLDFFRPVFDERTSQYYYISKIEDYIEGEPATVELIRM